MLVSVSVSPNAFEAVASAAIKRRISSSCNYKNEVENHNIGPKILSSYSNKQVLRIPLVFLQSIVLSKQKQVLARLMIAGKSTQQQSLSVY